MDSIRTKFDPLVNGFKFVNYFEFPDLFKINLPFIRSVPIAANEVVYGLCGGMSYASLDYFYQPKDIPTTTNVNEITYPFFTYLLQRQIDSLGKDALQKIFTYMVHEDHDLIRKVVQEEIPKLRGLLDQGKPAVLVLVRVKGLNDPTHSHQVVATGYDFNPDTSALTVYLYEPNHPNEVPTLSVITAGASTNWTMTQSTGEPLRGFFVSDYVSKPAA